MRTTLRTALAAAIALPALAIALPPAAGSNLGGVVTVYSTPSSAGTGPVDVAGDARGNMWFTVPNDAKIGRITSTGTVTMFPAPDIDPSTLCVPWHIAAGPDEAMWFTCLYGGIGRIAGDGTTALYPVSGGANLQWDIAAGPDGAMWFTQGGDDSIGRITTSGVITTYPIGQSGVNLRDIAAGPDGKLWFTTFTGPASGLTPYVGSITTTGTVTLTPITGALGLNGIAWGWDDQLWVTDFGGQKVWRLDPTALTYASVATPFANPKAIATGANAQMWVTEGDGGSGRVASYDGNLTVTTTTTGITSSLDGIAASANGDMWVPAFTTQEVASITSGVNPGQTPPSISGVASYAEQLTCNAATWAPAPDTVDVTWQRNGTDIALATSASHVITGTDVGAALTCANVAHWDQIPIPMTFYSSPVTPEAILPDPPGSPVATPEVQAVKVEWAAPASDGGAAITGYTVTASPGGESCTTSSLTCTVDGLDPRQDYTFTVIAANSVGPSPSAQAGPETPLPAVPSAPRDVRATAGDGTITVTWLAPASDGGSDLTGYTATVAPGGAACTTTTALSCSIDVPNGTRYSISVVATNAAGSSTPARPSGRVLPQGTCSVSASFLKGKTIPARGTSTLMTDAEASPGCRVLIKASAMPLLRGDIRPAKFLFPGQHRVKVLTRGMPQLIVVRVKAISIVRNANRASDEITRTWRTR